MLGCYHHPRLIATMVVQFIGGARLLETATGLLPAGALPVCQLRAAHHHRRLSPW